MGGDTPNEDEYSAALERLLEGCPACTQCSGQIGGAVSRGVVPHTEVEEGEAEEGEVGEVGVGRGGASGVGRGGRQAREACVPVCCSGKRVKRDV